MAGNPARPDYPEWWEAEVVLRDGGTAVVRPIRPDDAELLVAFYARVSEQSKYFRFFAPYPRLSARDVRRFTQLDYADRVGLVVTVAERMIAVGRYDRSSSRTAEVAFLVEDEHQGRGIGSVLLEHLAQAARENGIERFEAEILPENRRMADVFSEAGYRVTRNIDDGVIHVEFDVEPTGTSLDVMQAREQRAEARSVGRLLRPGSVAVVGASRSGVKLGRVILSNIATGGFTGRVYAVNSEATEEEIEGYPVYPSLPRIPDEVDLAVVAVPAEAVPDVVLDAAVKGVRGLVVVSSGFAETGRDGRRAQRRLVRLSRSYGLRLIGPSALGLINTHPDVNLNASLSAVMPGRGRVGFFSQSGALGPVILRTVVERGLGLSTFVSAGNRADVSGNDLMQYWEEDEQTDIVLLYLESIGNPRKFSRIARRLAQSKPIIALRSGRFTQSSPLGHSVHVPGVPPAAVDAMFRQAGVVLTDSLEASLDVAQLLAHQPLPAGGRIGVLGNSDALVLQVADAAAEHELPVAREATLAPDVDGEVLGRRLAEFGEDGDVDALVVAYASPVEVDGSRAADAIVRAAAGIHKPLIATYLGSSGMLRSLGPVPSYSSPRDAVAALARVVEHARWRRQPQGGEPELGIDPDADERAERLIESILNDHPGGTELGGDPLRRLLGWYGIETPAEPEPAEPDEAGTAVGRIAGSDPAAEGPRELAAPDDDPGVAFVVAAVDDPGFGPVVSFGLAGVATDLLDDWAYRIPPLSDVDSAQMVTEPRAARLLSERAGDLWAVERLLHQVGRLTDDLPQVASVRLRATLRADEEVQVTAATLQLGSSRHRSDWYTRRLNRP